jgi:hypothetical protein
MAFDTPQSRNEALLQNLLGAENEIGDPQSRIEAILTAMLNGAAVGEPYTDPPQSRNEELLMAIKTDGSYSAEAQSRIEKILKCKLERTAYTGTPQSRIEELLIQWLDVELPVQVIAANNAALETSGGALIQRKGRNYAE